MNRTWALSAFLVSILCAPMGCFSLRHGHHDQDAVEEAPMDTATTLITAASGGTVSLADGTRVEIPPGALEQDTEVSVSRPAEDSFGPDGILAAVLLEPDGLVFSQPVKLTIPFDPTGVEDTSELVVAVASSQNPQEQGGSEISIYQLVEDAQLEGEAFVVETTHFSAFAIAYAPRVFATPALPAKYLRPGDMLYTLTKAEKYSHGSMWPMHAGLFTKGTSGDEVIESTVETPDCQKLTKGVQRGTWSGNCGFWHLNGEHILVGIRRPTIKATAEQGQAAANAAASYLGYPYGILGLVSGVTGITCVQLVEQSWEIAGINVCYTPDILLSPFNQYQNTVPVKAITADIKDGEIKIPIVIAAKEGVASDYTALGKVRLEGTVTLTADIMDPVNEGRAVLKDAPMDAQEFKYLSFTPNQDDVDWSYTFGLEISVPSLGYQKTIKDFLKISVTGTTSGTGPACPLQAYPLTGASAYFAGTLSGTTSTGGDFSVGPTDTSPQGGRAYLYQKPDGTAWLEANVGGGNGAMIVEYPLPAPPQGGVKQTITHPGANWSGSYEETGKEWGYYCSLSDGRLMNFSVFDTFSGSIHVTPSADCSKLTLDVQQSDTAWDETTSAYVECVYQGTFTGSTCDPQLDPQRCL